MVQEIYGRINEPSTWIESEVMLWLGECAGVTKVEELNSIIDIEAHDPTPGVISTFPDRYTNVRIESITSEAHPPGFKPTALIVNCIFDSVYPTQTLTVAKAETILSTLVVPDESKVSYQDAMYLIHVAQRNDDFAIVISPELLARLNGAIK